MKELVRVLRCQAEIYEYLAGLRDECNIEEYIRLCDAVNRIIADSPKTSPNYRLHFDPRPGQAVIDRINSIIDG